jgi:hypothetical protein
MKKSASGLVLSVVLLAWSGWMLLAAPSSATLPMQKKAKEMGFAVENCLYCHNEKLPKKDAATYNERGQWLKDEKEKRKAKEVDVAWLKDYPGDQKK